jgi:hypothetical protein
MDSVLVAGVVSSLFGGFMVSITTFLGNRRKVAAEARKLDAEAERNKAETARLLMEIDGRNKNGAPLLTDTRSLVGWFPAGTSLRHYQFGVDKELAYEGTASGYIWSRDDPEGFGTLMQMFRADSYRGKRYRLSAFIRAEGVQDWAALWMRVDGLDGELLAFDNMAERPIGGTIDWRVYRIVLDVTEVATYIAFGVLLSGSGRIWIDDVTFEAVPEAVELTGRIGGSGYPDGPTNLDFER